MSSVSLSPQSTRPTRLKTQACVLQHAFGKSHSNTIKVLLKSIVDTCIAVFFQ